MLRRLFFTFTLALLFGLGQQGAAAHAVTHLADWQQQQDKSGHAQTCDKCVVYAGLSSALGCQSFALPPAPAAGIAYAARATCAASIFHLPYSARAPPVLV